MRETRILPRRKGYLLLCVLGCLFVFFVKTEKDLAANGNILWTAGYVGSTLAWSVILGCVLGIVGTRVVCHIAENTAARQKCQTQSQDNMDGADGRQKAIGYKRFAAWIRNRSGRQVLLGSILLLLLAWLPVYLAYYPGSVPMMRRCRPVRSWSITILIIIPSCILCFYRECCGWVPISSAV